MRDIQEVLLFNDNDSGTNISQLPHHYQFLPRAED